MTSKQSFLFYFSIQYFFILSCRASDVVCSALQVHWGGQVWDLLQQAGRGEQSFRVNNYWLTVPVFVQISSTGTVLIFAATKIVPNCHEKNAWQKLTWTMKSCLKIVSFIIILALHLRWQITQEIFLDRTFVLYESSK